MTRIVSERPNGGFNNYNSSNNLPTVTDPRNTYSSITRDEYLNFKRNFDGFENDLIDRAKNDTSLIDAAKEDTSKASSLMSAVSERNASRYGAALTPAQLQQQERALTRGTTLGSIQAVGDARIAQQEANTALTSDLINIGQGVNRSSQSQLGSAASDAQARANAYTQAKASAKAQTMATVGNIASSAIIAYAIFASDRRLKHNIEQVGVSDNGVNIYEFSYKGSDDRYQGVMADEVPWAVVERSVGYNMVDYNKVDVEFRRV
jgi:hypothetical protein